MLRAYYESFSFHHNRVKIIGKMNRTCITSSHLKMNPQSVYIYTGSLKWAHLEFLAGTDLLNEIIISASLMDRYLSRSVDSNFFFLDFYLLPFLLFGFLVEFVPRLYFLLGYFFFTINYFLSYLGCCQSLLLSAGFLSSCGVQASHWGSFSGCGTWALELRLSSCGSRA